MVRMETGEKSPAKRKNLRTVPHTLNGIDINPINEVISRVFFCHYNKIEHRRPI